MPGKEFRGRHPPVHHPTRQQAILDKIYSCIKDWYLKPVILLSIGTSYHNAISLSSKQFSMKRNDHRAEVKVRNNDPNGRNLLASYIWHEIESVGPKSLIL